MTLLFQIIACAALIFSVLALAVGVTCTIAYDNFNKAIKDWASELDSTTREAIDRSARQILRDLDNEISQTLGEQTEVKPINSIQDDESCRN